MTQRDDTVSDDQAAADRELVAKLEDLAELLNQESPEFGAILIGAALRLKEVTASA